MRHTCALETLARHLAQVAPTTSPTAEWYLEIHMCSSAVLEYLDCFAASERPLPVTLYFDIAEHIETMQSDANTHRDLRFVAAYQDKLAEIPRPRMDRAWPGG
jgi:recombinational DNA repair protein (RecF pathway)